MSVFFVYVDQTDDGRPFYVGKGTDARLRSKRRNAYWRNIAAKHGQRREVVLATKDEAFAFEQERRLIAELGTFEDGTSNRWGANLSEGGEGPSGHLVSIEARMRIATARRGCKFTEAHRENIRQAVTGRRLPCSEHRRLAIQRAKRTNSPVDASLAHAIREASGTQREIATRFNVSQSTVHNIRSGKRW